VDIGASYFTVSDEGFADVVQRWQRRELAREWTSSFDRMPPVPAVDTTPADHRRPIRWAAANGLRSLVRDLLGGIEVQLGHEAGEITQRDGGLLLDGEPADVIVLAAPDPQAGRLIAPLSSLGAVRARLDVPFDPVIAVTMGWRDREWPFTDGCFVNDNAVLTFVADDGARRGDGAAVLVAHTTPECAREHLWDATGAIRPVMEQLRTLFGIRAEPVWTRAHRWGIAKPAGVHREPFGWFDTRTGANAPSALTGDDGRLASPIGGVGIVGDSWCPTGSPRVESAWLSGTALARTLLECGLADG
jgi:hypothetical protein